MSTVPPSLKRQPIPMLSRTSYTKCFGGQWMTSSSLWYGASTSTRKNLLNSRPNWKPPAMPRRKRNEHNSRARIRLAVQCVGADWTLCYFGGRTFAIDRESQSEVSTLLLSRDIRFLRGCACLQHPVANRPECGRKGISAAADFGDRTP